MSLLLLLDEQGAGGAATKAYKTVQQATGTIPLGQASVDVTISSVNTSLTSLMWGGNTGSSADGNRAHSLARAELVGAATVRFTRGTNTSTGPLSCSVSVVEWASDWVDSVQRGTIAIANPATSNTATISSVTTSRSYVSFLGFSTDNITSGIAMAVMPVVSLTNGTTVTATMNSAESAALAVTVSYEVVQLKASKVRSIQYAEYSGTTTNLSENVTISSVTPSDCMVIPNGQYASAGNSTRILMAELTSATTVTFTRGSTTSTTYRAGVTVVELVNAFTAAANISDSGYVTTATAKDVTIASTDAAKSFLNYHGFNLTTSVNFQNILSRISYKDATTATFTRSGTDSLTGCAMKARTNTFRS